MRETSGDRSSDGKLKKLLDPELDKLNLSGLLKLGESMNGKSNFLGFSS